MGLFLPRSVHVSKGWNEIVCVMRPHADNELITIDK